MYFYLFFILLIVNPSLQLASDKEEKACNCYDQCQKNFTTNSVTDEQAKAACQRGCRFYSLVLHASHDLQPGLDFAPAKEGCLISCGESYRNPVEVSACNFACSLVTSTKTCDFVEHQLPQITYTLIIEESDVLIHPGDADPDDALIDPGLRKQVEKTLGTLLDSKPKLPEIHFRNLPISNKEIPPEHARTICKCPKFYGFDSKFEFRNGKITTSDLFFLFSVLIFAMICFIVSRNLEKQRKLWKQLLTSVMQNKRNLLQKKESFMRDDLLPKDDDYPEKGDFKDVRNEAGVEEGVIDRENVPNSKFEGITLVFYDDDDDDNDNDNGRKTDRSDVYKNNLNSSLLKL